MKTIMFTFLLSFFFLNGIAQQPVKMVIDGKPFDVKTNQEFKYITANGDTVTFTIKDSGEIQSTPVVKNSTQPSTNPQNFDDKGTSKSFSDILLAFNYPSNFSIAKTRPAENMQQITMVSGEGGGIIIQEFLTMNPKALVEHFLTGLVGEKNMRKAKNDNLRAKGAQLKGKTTTDDEGNTVAVYAHGKGSKGVIIATVGNQATDTLLKEFLQTLTIK